MSCFGNNVKSSLLAIVSNNIDAAKVPLQTPILHSLGAVVNLLAAGKAPIEITAYLAGGNLTALNKSKPGCPFDVRAHSSGRGTAPVSW